MPCRHLSLSFILVALVIFLAHSIIPHHHEVQKDDAHHAGVVHHHYADIAHHHHHHGDSGEENPDNVFSDWNHPPADSFFHSSKGNATKDRIVTQLICLLPDADSEDEYLLLPLLLYPDRGNLSGTEYIPLCHAQRGPPALT
jgi:hypothetical protein